MLTFTSIFKEELGSFLAVRKAALSESTIKHDICYLLSFDAFIVKIGLQEKEISEQVINDWQKTLTGKASSKANKIIVIRIFIRYIRTLGLPAYMPIVPKVADSYSPYIFSDDELDRIFDAADNIAITGVQPNKNMRAAFPMILRLLYGCGLRIGETLSLRIRDVDLEGGILTLLHTKNEKHRLVPMSHSLTETLQLYCLATGIVGIPNAFLFPSADPSVPMSVRSVRNKFDVILRNLKIKTSNGNRYERERGPCQHSFRHVFVFKSFAQMQQSGASIDDCIPFLSTYLGHDSLRETEKYLKFSAEMFPSAMELFESYAGMVFSGVDHEE